MSATSCHKQKKCAESLAHCGPEENISSRKKDQVNILSGSPIDKDGDDAWFVTTEDGETVWHLNLGGVPTKDADNKEKGADRIPTREVTQLDNEASGSCFATESFQHMQTDMTEAGDEMETEDENVAPKTLAQLTVAADHAYDQRSRTSLRDKTRDVTSDLPSEVRINNSEVSQVTSSTGNAPVVHLARVVYLIPPKRLPGEIKKYTCSVCGKVVSSLKTHMRTHTGEKPFKCSVCSASFTINSALTAHKRMHTGEKPYLCSFCGREFALSSSLTTHIRSHTGERPFGCTHCSKKFAQSSGLKLHMLTHTGEKPHRCTMCSHACTTAGNLRAHMRTHAKENRKKSTESDDL